MHNAYVVTGRLRDTQTVELDETLPVAAARVRVVLEVLSAPGVLSSSPAPAYRDVMAAIRERQEQRGHRAPSRTAVDAHLQEERNNWQ